MQSKDNSLAWQVGFSFSHLWVFQKIWKEEEETLNIIVHSQGNVKICKLQGRYNVDFFWFSLLLDL